MVASDTSGLIGFALIGLAVADLAIGFLVVLPRTRRKRPSLLVFGVLGVAGIFLLAGLFLVGLVPLA